MIKNFYAKTQGFSLIEVMIAWAVMSSVMLALLHNQILALRRTHQALRLSYAATQLDNARRAKQFGWPATYFQQWRHDITAWLPHGRGHITSHGTGCQIEITWRVRDKTHRVSHAC